jgi:hypothetical protein
MKQSISTRGDAAIELIQFADKKLNLSDGDAASAFVLAACFLAGDNRESLFSLIKLIIEADGVLTGPENEKTALA